MKIQFTVYGTPQPQGSLKSFIYQKAGKPRVAITTDNPKLRPWRQDLAILAREAMKEEGESCATGPVAVTVYFFFLRPRSFKTRLKITKPDIDKLLRGLLDGLSGVVFIDDAQVVRVVAEKCYCNPVYESSKGERTEITVEVL